MNTTALCLLPRPRHVLRSASTAALALRLPQRHQTSEAWSEALLASTDVLGAVLHRRSIADWLSDGQELPDGFAPEQGYVLRVEPSGITLATDSEAGRRNGLHTLAQLVFQYQAVGQLPALAICDWPRMRVRCAHLCYHLAQPWVPLSFPNFPALIRLVKRLAHYKINAVLLEIEALFPYRRHPEVSAPHAFRREEIDELRQTCARWGVEIIPLLQCLGHAYAVLRHPQHAHLRETPDTLQQYCPSNPATRKLYHALADELCDAFGPVRHFHIGGDESRRLGICPDCRRTAALEGVGTLYGRHVGAVARSLLERGVTPVAWADMIEHHPAALAHLPLETELVHWKYSVRPPGVRIDFQQFGEHSVWAASGVRFGKSNHTMHRFQESLQGIAALAAEAERAGCDRWMVTDWMKAVPFEHSEIGLAYAAEAGWQGGRSFEAFTAAYTRILHGTAMPDWWRIHAALEPELPYAEDAQAHRYDLLDRHDYSGLSFRQRMERTLSAAERDDARMRLTQGLSAAREARLRLDRLRPSVLCHAHAWDMLSLSTDLHAHKARLGLALDEAARILKYPLPDDAAPRNRLVERFQDLVLEHDRLRGRAEELLARETLAPNDAALVDMYLEPAAREWMLYFSEALRCDAPLPMLFGEEHASRPLPGAIPNAALQPTSQDAS